jgi:cytochrome c oxidase assembly factor CtaG
VIESVESELAAWSPEWTASAILLATALIYVRGWMRERNGARLGAFLGGLVLLAVAVASPLEALDDLFLSAHMTQHFLLMMAAPPLLLAGHPFVPLLRGLPKAFVKRGLRPLLTMRVLKWVASWLVAPPVAAGLFAFSTIFWHTPKFYELALSSPVWHNLEHATFFWTGILFWWPVVETQPRWVTIPYLLFGDLINTGLSAFFVF